MGRLLLSYRFSVWIT